MKTEREYLLDLASWSQKMGFACLAIIERTTERRRLTDQIGNMMVPEIVVTSQMDVYIDNSFTEMHFEALEMAEELVMQISDAGLNMPVRRPGNTALVTAPRDPPGDNPSSDNPADTGPSTDTGSEGGDEAQPDNNGNLPEETAPLTLTNLLREHRKNLKFMKKLRNVTFQKAAYIDLLQSRLPKPFIPLYNKAEEEMEEVRKRIQRAVKRLLYRLVKYVELLAKDVELREQIYQNLLHVTPLQVLLLGHLPRDHQAALIEVVTSVRKFSVPLLITRMHELERSRELELGDLTGKFALKV